MTTEFQKPEISITSYGGVEGTVTGSCHVFESGHSGNGRYNKVVVDCGIFQGKADLAGMKRKMARGHEVVNKISEDNPSILLTHAHIDHVGFIPLLYRNGCNSLIYTTEETRKLLEVNLTRSAMLQQKGNFSSDFYFEPEDVGRVLRHIQTVKPFEEMSVTRDKKIKAVFCPNGHIPGSSSIVLKDQSNGKNVLFTGDIGRPEQLIIGGYDRYASKYPQDPIHAVVTESTCYPETPIPFEKRITMFQDEINNAFDRGNTVLMPCIQHRFMENKEIIRNSQIEGKLPKTIDFFLDGPALADISDIYKNFDPDYLTTRYGDNPDFYDPESSQLRFNLDNLHTIWGSKDSQSFINMLNSRRKNTIIFASGGMGNDGRAYNYLRRGFTLSPENTVIFSCYQVEGTAGSDLLKRQNNPKYQGARVVKLDGGSGHATGKEEIFGFLKRFNLDELKNVVIVHGDNTSRESMKEGLQQTDFGERVKIKLPNIGERIDLAA